MSKKYVAILMIAVFTLSTLSGCIGDTGDEDNDAIIEDYSNLQSQISDLKVNNTILENEKNNLIAENDDLNREIEQLTIDVDNIILQINNKTAIVDDLTDKLQESTDNESGLISQINQLELDITQLNQDLQILSSSLNDSISYQNQLLQEISVLEDDRLINESQMDVLTLELTTLNAKIESLHSQTTNIPNQEQIDSCPESHPPDIVFQTGFDDGTGNSIANDGLLEDGEIIQQIYECSFISGNLVTVMDINPNGDSDPKNLFPHEGNLLFTANDGSNGRELWITDGTLGGTRLVKDINPGFADSNPTDFVAMNGLVYFSAFTQAAGTELWVTDGTSEGTEMLYDAWPGISSGYVDYLINLDGTLYFAANDGLNGQEPWSSDGTSLNTAMIKDINPDFDSENNIGDGSISANSLTDVFILFDGNVYFTAYTSTYGAEPWVTDGTKENTSLFIDFYPGEESSQSLIEFTPAFIGGQNKMLFTANASLWSTDGTVQGTIELDSQGFFGYFTIYQGGFYYLTRDSLYKTDGTIAGTQIVERFYGSSSACFNPNIPNSGYAFRVNDLIATSNGLFFAADLGYNTQPRYGPSYEIVISDGTQQSLREDINSHIASSSTPSNLVCQYVSSFPYDFKLISNDDFTFKANNDRGFSGSYALVDGYIYSDQNRDTEYALLGDMLFKTENGELDFIAL